jgi:hypothetical protein
LRRLVSGWQTPAAPAPLRISRNRREQVRAIQDAPKPPGETARHIGTALHGFLQRIAREGLSRWNEAFVRNARGNYRAALANLGVPPHELASAAARVETGLLSTIRDARGQWILEEHLEAECEAQLAGVVDGNFIEIAVDRTFVDEAGARWIIDYKTSEPHGRDLDAFLEEEKIRYQDQLERYARLLAQRDTRIIRLGLYFPLAGGWREWGAATAKREHAAQGLLFEL